MKHKELPPSLLSTTATFAELKIVYLDPVSLNPPNRQLRRHSKKQIKLMAKSIKEFGFINPIIIDRHGRVIAGIGRVLAAILLGLKSIPTICIDYLTPEQIRAYAIAENHLAESAGWDKKALMIELGELHTLNVNLDMLDFNQDLYIVGTPGDGDYQPPLQQTSISKLGDLWLLGEHRILCGDATIQEYYNTLMNGHVARMIFTDPPYNVAVDGHICGSGKIKHREFVQASGEMSFDEFVTFLMKTFKMLVKYSDDGSIHYICMDWRHMAEILAAAKDIYTEFKQLCVWNKDNGGMGTFYRSKHELVFVFKNGRAVHINNFGLGESGRYRTNVWDYAGVNTFKKDRQDELSMHPTVKPVAMVADAIKDCSNRGDIILDPFSGSGTTLIAAEQTGRLAYVMELDPLYVDVAIRRWQKLTGKQAVLSATGQTFNELEQQRKETNHG